MPSIKPSLTPPNSRPGLFNWDPLLLPRTRYALSQVRTNQGRAIINFIGDSGFIGQGAGTPNTDGAFPKSIPSYFQKLLAQKDLSLPTRRSFSAISNFTSTVSITNYLAWDARMSASAGWADGTDGLGFGHPVVNSTDTGALAFTPEETWDSAKVWWLRKTSTGTWTLDISGLSTKTQASGAASLQTTAIGQANGDATPVGTHTLNAKWVSGGPAMVAAAECWDSTKNDVLIRNLAGSGTMSSNYASSASAWSFLNGAASYGGDLTFIRLYRNDQFTGVAPATFQANMQSIITACKAFGDVILVRGHEPNPANFANLPNDSAFVAVLKSLAITNGCPLIDVVAHIGHYASASLQPIYYSDTVHYNANGWQQEAMWYADLIASL